MREGTSSVSSQPVVIVGGGISGLCVAFWLQQQGFQVHVLERNSKPGGTIETNSEHGWMVESGPNSALETTPLFQQLFTQLGISEQVVYANSSAERRYIVRNGALHQLPMSPLAFVTSNLWSFSGKLRILKEPFVGRGDREESIAEFVQRRLGQEFLDYTIDPFVAGVFAGIPEKLSVRAAFPKLYALEEKYGGLVKGMLKGRRERKKRAEVAKDRARLFSFRDGMQTLPNALASRLHTSIQFNCLVDKITPGSREPRSYSISYSQNGTAQTIEASAVVLALPAAVTSGLVHQLDPLLSQALASIYYPPVTEVFTGFKLDQIKRPLDGFGFLIPNKEQRNILGTIWLSAIFSKRAPDGHAALTSFIGGSRQPELAHRSDNELTQIVMNELRSLMGVEGDPAYLRINRWERAIPQYDLGYSRVLDAIESFEKDRPGIFLCANYRGGISVGDCVMSSDRTARDVVEFLGS